MILGLTSHKEYQETVYWRPVDERRTGAWKISVLADRFHSAPASTPGDERDDDDAMMSA